MTTFEHAMLGITGVLSVGLHPRCGWSLAAVAGVAAASPDWDGLTLLAGRAAFAAYHRLWGHNVLACLVIGVLIGGVDYRFDLVTRCGRSLARLLRLQVQEDRLRIRDRFTLPGLSCWIVVASLAALSHLPADLVFSGTSELPDWQLQPWWPFSTWSCIFPLVPWGDVGASMVLFAGMFALLKWPRRTQAVSLVTLLLLGLYVLVRGTV